MKSSPTRKYEHFSSDTQKETDKYSLDSQDTASVVSAWRIIDFVWLYKLLLISTFLIVYS